MLPSLSCPAVTICIMGRGRCGYSWEGWVCRLMTCGGNDGEVGVRMGLLGVTLCHLVAYASADTGVDR